MLLHSIRLLAIPAALGCLAATGVASAVTIDFDDLAHGEIVNNQYQAGHGVTITAENFHRSFDLAVAFDTNLSQTRDPDLESPWSGGNLPATHDAGKVLILQENNYNPNQDNIVDRPDDEGRRPAGRFVFDFDKAINSFGFTLVDIEGPAEYYGGYFLSIYNNEEQVAQIDFADFVVRDAFDPVRQAAYDMYNASNRPVFGDHSINTILPLDADLLGGEFDRVVMGLGGSGGIDDLTFTTAVPTPSTFTIGAVLLTLAGLRRRRVAAR
jgi:hypothetical protein